MLIFLLVIGIIVFGPKKTIEMAQGLGHALAKLKATVEGAGLASLSETSAGADSQLFSSDTKRPWKSR